ncbi:hypothetical protein C8N32_104171 [Rhodovulum imhoffii]|uniref:Uncharacterized protein n=1 Tax=Rhodovulum imhoffii TaxID=365340 RepID=A0A2T5BUA9_9RHOB|nr:hypothetical protein [Rhodovulum imhoffii]MBK5934523.1 hypothetical protein [Rhodovulum imhoffii]PTN03060.1 hypothetical protein C8N32_104171 [Rhodovulum imhoffii]
MSFFRAQAIARLLLWREVLIGSGALGLGVWLASRGGALFYVLGAVVVLAGGSMIWVALRRLRFGMGGQAPGMVEVREGQISYLAQAGGFAALSELTEIRVIFDDRNIRFWQLFQDGLPTLTIPADATGGGDLFDAFVSLPGARPVVFLAARARPASDGPVTVWRRRAGPALT